MITPRDRRNIEADLQRLKGRRVLLWSLNLYVVTLNDFRVQPEGLTVEFCTVRRFPVPGWFGSRKHRRREVLLWNWSQITPFPGGFRDDKEPGIAIVTCSEVIESVLAEIEGRPWPKGDDAAVRVFDEWERADPARSVLRTPPPASAPPAEAEVPPLPCEALVAPSVVRSRRVDALNGIGWLERHASQCNSGAEPGRTVAQEAVAALLNIARAAIDALDRVAEANPAEIKEAAGKATSWPVTWPAHRPSRRRVEERMLALGLASGAPVHLPTAGKQWDEEAPANAFVLAIRRRIQERRMRLEIELAIRQKTGRACRRMEQTASRFPREGTDDWFALAMRAAEREWRRGNTGDDVFGRLRHQAMTAANKDRKGDPLQSNAKVRFMALTERALRMLFPAGDK